MTASFSIYGCNVDDDMWDVVHNPEGYVRLLKKLKQEFPKDYLQALKKIKESNSGKDELIQIQINIAEIVDDIKIVDALSFFSEYEDEGRCYLELAYEFLQHFGLEIHSSFAYGIWIGRSWATIKDDETGGMFKLRIQELIQSLFSETCETYPPIS